MLAAHRPAPIDSIPAMHKRREPQRSASGPLSTPSPKYRKPASENTSDTEPREAAKSRCNESTKALKVYALPKPTKVTAKAAAMTNQAENTRGGAGDMSEIPAPFNAPRRLPQRPETRRGSRPRPQKSPRRQRQNHRS